MASPDQSRLVNYRLGLTDYLVDEVHPTQHAGIRTFLERVQAYRYCVTVVVVLEASV